MKRTTDALFTAALGVMLACGTAPAVADEFNPLKDESFELRLPADQGGWETFGPSRFSEDHARQGNRSMFNGATSKTVAYPPYFVGTVTGSFQEFPARAGSRWRLTGFGLAAEGLVGTPAFGIIQLSFFAANGDDLGTVETVGSTTAKAKLSNEINNQSPVGEWIALDTGIATAPEGAATVQAFTLFVDYSGSDTFQGVYFDNLNLCALQDGDASQCKRVADDGASGP